MAARPGPFPGHVIIGSVTFPKIELHAHLEGTVRAQTLLRVARRNGVPLPADSAEELAGLYEFRDFRHFIEVWELTTCALQTADDFRQVVVAYAAEAAGHGAVYLEGIFTPAEPVSRGTSWEEVFDGYCDGAVPGWPSRTGKRMCGCNRAGMSGCHVAMQLETFDLGPADKESGCIDASDGVAVARRGLKSVRGRVVLPDRDDNAITAAAPEQVSFEPLVSTEHRQRLRRGEALVLLGLCLIDLGPPDPHDHRLTVQHRLGRVNPGSRRATGRSPD
jgi:hypothetical protein